MERLTNLTTDPYMQNQLSELPQEEQTEVDDLKNCLYLLHTTPAIDVITYATGEHQTMQKLAALIKMDRLGSQRQNLPMFNVSDPFFHNL